MSKKENDFSKLIKKLKYRLIIALLEINITELEDYKYNQVIPMRGVDYKVDEINDRIESIRRSILYYQEIIDEINKN